MIVALYMIIKLKPVANQITVLHIRLLFDWFLTEVHPSIASIPDTFPDLNKFFDPTVGGSPQNGMLIVLNCLSEEFRFFP